MEYFLKRLKYYFTYFICKSNGFKRSSKNPQINNPSDHDTCRDTQPLGHQTDRLHSPIRTYWSKFYRRCHIRDRSFFGTVVGKALDKVLLRLQLVPPFRPCMKQYPTCIHWCTSCHPNRKWVHSFGCTLVSDTWSFFHLQDFYSSQMRTNNSERWQFCTAF